MPSSPATAQACWAPAPPKATSAWPAGSYPRRSEIERIASAMRSFGDVEQAGEHRLGAGIERRPIRCAQAVEGPARRRGVEGDLEAVRDRAGRGSG